MGGILTRRKRVLWGRLQGREIGGDRSGEGSHQKGHLNRRISLGREVVGKNWKERKWLGRSRQITPYGADQLPVIILNVVLDYRQFCDHYPRLRASFCYRLLSVSVYVSSSTCRCFQSGMYSYVTAAMHQMCAFCQEFCIFKFCLFNLLNFISLYCLQA